MLQSLFSPGGLSRWTAVQDEDLGDVLNDPTRRECQRLRGADLQNIRQRREREHRLQGDNFSLFGLHVHFNYFIFHSQKIPGANFSHWKRDEHLSQETSLYQHFTICKPWSPGINVLGLQKYLPSTEFEALKVAKCLVRILLLLHWAWIALLSGRDLIFLPRYSSSDASSLFFGLASQMRIARISCSWGA